jgi:hypothetical protein
MLDLSIHGIHEMQSDEVEAMGVGVCNPLSTPFSFPLALR